MKKSTALKLFKLSRITYDEYGVIHLRVGSRYMFVFSYNSYKMYTPYPVPEGNPFSLHLEDAIKYTTHYYCCRDNEYKRIK